MKILTIGEPECGAKPTSYAAVLKDDSEAGIRKQLEQGFKFGFVQPVFMSPQALNKAAKELFRDDYAWIGLGQEYLAEITDLEKDGDRTIDAEMLLQGLKNGTINITVRPLGVDEEWARKTVEDCVKYVLK